MKALKKVAMYCINWIKAFFANREKQITNWLKHNSEFLTIPIALLAWFVFMFLAQKMNLTTYDSGIFQKLIFAFIAVLVLKALTWFILSIDQPFLKNYLDSENTEKWNSFTDQQKMHYSLVFFVLYFASFVFIVALT
jgi:NhaP-type Na+/H+ or K+/H+ antiporter